MCWQCVCVGGWRQNLESLGSLLLLSSWLLLGGELSEDSGLRERETKEKERWCQR